MIYILKGCKGVCACPGETCQACAEGCQECTKGCCAPVAECVTVTCNTVTNIWERPLGCYVFFTFIASVTMWAFCITAVAVEKEVLFGESPSPTPAPLLTTTPSELTADDRRLHLSWDYQEAFGYNEDASGVGQPIVGRVLAEAVCEKKGLILGMFAADFFVFLINIFFAVYIQNQVWAGLVELVKDEEREALTTRKAIKRRNVAELVADSTKQVCLYDFCFCFYFFFLFGQLAFNWWMYSSPVGEPHCDKLKWSTDVALLGIWYPALVIMYSFGWFYFLQCYSACETCCKPFGGCTCCFGKRPDPEGGAYYDDDAPMVNPGAPVHGVLVAPAQQLQPMPMGALPDKKKKKKKKGGCSIM